MNNEKKLETLNFYFKGKHYHKVIKLSNKLRPAFKYILTNYTLGLGSGFHSNLEPGIKTDPQVWFEA